jgi:hypothetical protein
MSRLALEIDINLHDIRNIYSVKFEPIFLENSWDLYIDHQNYTDTYVFFLFQELLSHSDFLIFLLLRWAIYFFHIIDWQTFFEANRLLTGVLTYVSDKEISRTKSHLSHWFCNNHLRVLNQRVTNNSSRSQIDNNWLRKSRCEKMLRRKETESLENVSITKGNKTTKIYELVIIL